MPSDAFEELFDREQLLGGLPAKRANTLLFLIESRTARLTAQSRQAMQRFATREAAQERELAFIEAFALGREPPLRPTIQDLERHAPRWAALVARNPRVQAALAHRLGEKHRFVARPGAVHPAPRSASTTRASRPPTSSSTTGRWTAIYVERPSPRERLRWARARARRAPGGHVAVLDGVRADADRDRRLDDRRAADRGRRDRAAAGGRDPRRCSASSTS